MISGIFFKFGVLARAQEGKTAASKRIRTETRGKHAFYEFVVVAAPKHASALINQFLRPTYIVIIEDGNTRQQQQQLETRLARQQ